MKKVTIKTETSYGKPATPATEKQTKWAQDIVERINVALKEVHELGFSEIADEAAGRFDEMTNGVEAGPKDIIEYLKDIDRYSVFSECYTIARQGGNSAAVKALNPRAL